jgi:hypothetical protein
VRWEFGIDETREETRRRIALFREFLRRGAPFAGIQDADALPAPWPFFDVAARIDRTIRAPRRAVAEIVAHVPQYPVTAVRATCVFALHFAALVDAGRAPAPDRDPFAPLVFMYELGGMFGRDGTGAIEIGTAAFGCGARVDWLDAGLPEGLPEFPELAGVRR